MYKKMLDITEIEKRLAEKLSLKRFSHSINVSKTAIRMARLFKESIDKAAIAGLLHDCARDIDNEEIFKKAAEFNIKIDELDKESPVLLHARVGAYIAKKEFDIKDKEILDAIAQHTVGGKNLCTLSKIIYLADLIEPSRNFKEVDKLRKLALKNLDKAMLYAYDIAIEYNLEKNKTIHPATIEGRNELLLKSKQDKNIS
ncbi:bis(5'-nucleosyl)-tetraphosphatase (symmetrical) YqeK [Selenomonadales bacterium OttesenSCG-928-I06]|nr:bis(5'-nucleosyl)-tetraphosphatase (symmetrical) YqeK [Selenomonadales bacterium OttesenSCG-928-I06]